MALDQCRLLDPHEARLLLLDRPRVGGDRVEQLGTWACYWVMPESMNALVNLLQGAHAMR